MFSRSEVCPEGMRRVRNDDPMIFMIKLAVSAKPTGPYF